MTGIGTRCRQLALQGEDLAAHALEQAGYEILGRNVRFRHGEIDIVARDGLTVVFVEVKTRRSDRYGTPQEAVDHRKQARLRSLAATWLQARGMPDVRCRFDVMAVRWPADPQAQAVIDHFRHAF